MRRFISLPLRVVFMTAFILTLHLAMLACLLSVLVPIGAAVGPAAASVALVLASIVSGVIAGTFTAWHYRHLAFALAAPLILFTLLSMPGDPLASALGWLAIIVSYCVTGLIRSRSADTLPPM